MELEAPSLQLADFMELFAGNRTNYGQHQYNFKEGEVKEAGKNSTVTNKLLTIDQYKAHLNGTIGLGIIPIDDKGDVRFGVIDIDVYDTDLMPYIRAIERHNLPLVPFKSKSGGLHLYMFMKQPVNAKAVIELLTKQVNILGLDLYIKHKLNRIIEIFPKQSKLNDGNVGSWINMPYYNAVKTRQCAIRNGKDLTLDEALAYIKSKRTTLTDVRTMLNELPHADGPPCLQTIDLLGNMSKGSGRNNYLFSFGVYLKKKDPEFWEQHLFEVNAGMEEPIEREELEQTIESLRKKDYLYKCNEAPCVDFCRKSLCKTREFGIGKEGGYFSDLEYGKFTQIHSYEPYYEWEVKLQGTEEFKILRFKNEADIIGQDAFLRLCIRELHRLPIKIKQSEWYNVVNQALATITIQEVEKEDDTSPIGMFKALFIEFLDDRAMAQTKEQIFNRRVYKDDKNGKYYFRTCDLSDFMFVAKAFRYYSPSELHGLLRDFKAEPCRIKTESGRQIRVYSMTSEAVANIGKVEVEPFKAEFTKDDDKF